MFERVFIIAEVGSSQDGTLETARKYIHAVAKTGADAIKFQTIHPELFLAPELRTGRFITLSDEWYPELFGLARSLGLKPFSTPFDEPAVDMLVNAGAELMKIASCDVTNFGLIYKVGLIGLPVLLSTGMSTMLEVCNATAKLQCVSTGDIVLLHCISCYPAKSEEMNLLAMVEMGKKCQLPVGLSDHTLDKIASLGAVALGARVIEKHVTFDRTRGGDHAFAMEFSEFENMIQEIRDLESCLGTDLKAPCSRELSRIDDVRRGLYAAHRIEAGEQLTQDNIIALRPARGCISPQELDRLLKFKAPHTFERWEPFCRSDFKVQP